MLEIRPVTADDAGALLEVLGDVEVARWLRRSGELGAFTASECEAMIVQKVAHWTAHGFGMSLAFADGRCVGRAIVQHNQVAARSEVEVGWAVARSHWGQGFGTVLGRHALAAATAAGFARVVAFTRPENAASRRVMEKLDMRHERDFTHAGLPHVLYVYGPA